MTTESVWYQEGLSFECTGCGDCCRGPGGSVWVGPDEVARLAEKKGMETQPFSRRYLRRISGRLALIDGPHGDCIFLNEAGQCGVYEARPVQCRTYPFWPEVVGTKEDWEREKKVCPGIGEPTIVSVAEIMKNLSR